MGMLIPWNDPRNLSDSSSVTVSPFTIVFEIAGLSSVAHIMNAVILITVNTHYLSFDVILTYIYKHRFFLVLTVVCMLVLVCFWLYLKKVLHIQNYVTYIICKIMQGHSLMMLLYF